MAKFRNAQSYYGNTAEARRRQRDNLIPGGNITQKRKISEARLNCWWENNDLETKQFIFEGYENRRKPREFDAMPKEELKDEKYLNNWWGRLDLENKKFIYKTLMKELTPQEKAPILESMQECLQRKLARLNRG